ncbi:NAD-dependent epimerase/dehydratase family protein [Streptomyces sp. NPDC002730]|uniref:NAD-dependent epimerase/dehydratase family protein n=1 Tax=Streptomyces sp. NPDC002730 TaxID=3364662 RepID=UPI0036B7BB13
MKVLVTGASGFLGGHLADGAVRAGHDVRVLVRRSSDITRLRVPGLELVYGDLADEESLRRAVQGVDVVHHSAARVVEFGTRAQFWEANVAGTERLMAAARAGGVSRFVFISSPSALMEVGQGDRLGINETTPYPQRYYNLYSQTKALAEQLVLTGNAPGFTTVSLRPRGIWGPRDHSGFLPRLVAKMVAGKLPDMSGGRRVQVSLCHCYNAVAACLLAANAPAEQIAGKAYFIADRETTDVRAFLLRLAALFGGQPPTRTISPRLSDALAGAIELIWRVPALAAGKEPPLSRYTVALLTRSATYDTSAATRDFGYAPVIDQDSGLHQLLAWVESIGGTQEFLRTVR